MGSLAKQPPRAGAARKGGVCSVETLLDSLDDVDREALLGWLNDSQYQHTAIADALQASGYDISAYPINRHRKGRCMCQRFRPEYARG